MALKENLQDQSYIKEELHVVLGINGNVGRFVAKELTNLGYRVRGISRTGQGSTQIEVVKADALNVTELTNAVKGATVIYHCLGLPYSQWFKKHKKIMKNLIEAATFNGPKTKIVFADNLYAYGKQGAKLGPMSEQSPELATDRKGLLRKELVRLLLEAQSKGFVQVAIGRASDFFGPFATNSLLRYFAIPYIVKRKPARFFANLDSLHSWIYLPDYAKALVMLGTDSMANGKVWIVPHYETTTIRQFIDYFYISNNINIPIKIKKRKKIFLLIAGLFNKDIQEYSKMNYQMQSDWIIDDALFRHSFPNWKSTELNFAFTETMSFFIKNPL